MSNLNTMKRLDALEGVYFENQLEAQKAETYDILYPNFKARQILPISNTSSFGDEKIVYDQYEEIGHTEWISDYTTELPPADVVKRRFESPIREFGNQVKYSIKEIRQSAKTGSDLPGRRLAAARNAAESTFEQVAAVGSANENLFGALNHPNVPVATVPAGASASTLWVNKTPQEILADMIQAVSSIIDATEGVHSPNSIILPMSQYGLIAQTRMTDSTETILSYFLATNPFITFVDWWAPAKGAGVGGLDRMMVLQRDAGIMTFEITHEFEILAAQEHALHFEVPCFASTGGVLVYRPLAVAYRDGI